MAEQTDNNNDQVAVIDVPGGSGTVPPPASVGGGVPVMGGRGGPTSLHVNGKTTFMVNSLTTPSFGKYSSLNSNINILKFMLFSKNNFGNML